MIGVRVCATLAASAGLSAGAPLAAAAPQTQGMGGMVMVGNMKPYPNLHRAGAANVRRARRLVRASLAAAPRFNTIAKARRLGYVLGPRNPRRPGFTHMRKDSNHFTGRMFDPEAPQALVFWCPRHGRCALSVFMFRAPPGAPPSTWGNIIQWHRHARTMTTTWMMHLWLARHTREAFATCAPMPALAWRGIFDGGRRYTPWNHEFARCPQTPEMPM